MITGAVFFTKKQWKWRNDKGNRSSHGDSCGSGSGMLEAAKIEECYRQMRYLRKLIFRIRSEIRYSRRVLPEAFLSVGSEAQEPYKDVAVIFV